MVSVPPSHIDISFKVTDNPRFRAWPIEGIIMSPKAQPGIAPKRESQPNSTPRKYMRLTAVFVEIPGGGYMGYVEELPGANTEGTTLEETRENLQDAVNEMMLADRELTEELIEAEANREFTKEVISELSLTGRVHREELLLPAAA